MPSFISPHSTKEARRQAQRPDSIGDHTLAGAKRQCLVLHLPSEDEAEIEHRGENPRQNVNRKTYLEVCLNHGRKVHGFLVSSSSSDCAVQDADDHQEYPCC
jgi:hypothetical protein